MNVRESSLARRLHLALGLTALVLAFEVAGGIMTRSLALLSEAGHVLADLAALGVTAYALRLARVPPDRARTFGYHRAEVFAALVNGASLAVISVGIVIAAARRLASPVAVDSAPMSAVAAVGLAANLGVIALLHRHGKTNLNVQSALMHVVGDLLASVAVLAGGLIMWATGWYIIDPLLSLLVTVVIARGAVRLLRESIHILLEGTPRSIELGQVERAIQEIPGVVGVHDLHVWSLCSDYCALSAHVLVAEESTANTRVIVGELGRMLEHRFRIVHATIQPESEACAEPLPEVCAQGRAH